MAFPSDLEIARGATLAPLVDVAGAMGLGSHLLEPYGDIDAHGEIVGLS